MMADYISREAAVKVLTSIGTQVSDSRRRAVAKCINEIELLHAADVEPVRHGRWIEGRDHLKCPVCRGLAKKDFRDGCWNYCPNCGAKMDAKE